MFLRMEWRPGKKNHRQMALLVLQPGTIYVLLSSYVARPIIGTTFADNLDGLYNHLEIFTLRD